MSAATSKQKAPERQLRGPSDNTSKRTHFSGTSNPRHLRALAALLRHPVTRQALDSTAGAANGPDLVAELRRRGLDVPCERIRFIDRDGKACRPGVYAFTDSDRRRVYRWLAEREARA